MTTFLALLDNDTDAGTAEIILTREEAQRMSSEDLASYCAALHFIFTRAAARGYQVEEVHDEVKGERRWRLVK